MAITYYDPTDHHPVPAPQRPLYATGAELLQARIARGICSDADCGLPIDGWCVTCRAKLCERHLHDHHNQHTREYLHAQAAQMADDPDELAARRRAAGAVEMSDADYQRMIDDEIAEELAAEFFGDVDEEA